MNAIVACLVDHSWCWCNDDITVESLVDVAAAIVKGRKIPAGLQCGEAQAVVHVLCIAFGANLLPVLNAKAWRNRLVGVKIGAGLANVVVAGNWNPEDFGVELIGEIFGSGGPLRDAHLVEVRQYEFAHVACRNYVSEEETNHFSPNNILFAEAEIPVACTVVEVIFA